MNSSGEGGGGRAAPASLGAGGAVVEKPHPDRPVPGIPTEAIQATTKQAEMNGILFARPPNEGMSREWVWS